MRSSNHHNSRQLRSILAIGFGSSSLLHLGLIWGLAHWWQPASTGDEPIEITLVEPVEIAPVKSTPPIEIASKPAINQPLSPVIPTPTPTKIVPAIVKRSSAPKRVKSPPKQTVIKPKSTPTGIGVKPSSTPKPLSPAIAIATIKIFKPGSPPTKPKAQPNRMPISKANLPFPSNFGAAVRDDRSSSPPTRSFSFPISPKPQSTAKFTPTPVNSPIPARSDSSEQARASNPLPANPLPSPTPLTSDRSIEPIQPTPAISKPLTRSANNLQQPKDPPRSIVSMTGSANDNPLVGSNNARQVKPSNPTGGGVVPKQSGTNPVNSSAMSSTNTSGDRSNTNNGASTGNPGAVNAVGKADGKIGGVATGNNSGNGSGNSGNGSGNSGLQCIQNCQIAKLQDLQDRDSGKDRLRIRVTIDANGIVTAAEIAKSSGNPQLDQTVLNGIERMQFQPSGKPIKGIIRANIFL